MCGDMKTTMEGDEYEGMLMNHPGPLKPRHCFWQHPIRQLFFNAIRNFTMQQETRHLECLFVQFVDSVIGMLNARCRVLQLMLFHTNIGWYQVMHILHTVLLVGYYWNLKDVLRRKKG